MRWIPWDELDKPIKVIRDCSMVNGLEEGQKESSDFTFLSNRCNTFQRMFGEDVENIEFDVDWWNNQFDDPKQKTMDKERGFVDGHFNLGWGRCGVNEATHASQTKSACDALALPHIINKDCEDACQKLGNIPDLVQTFCDKCVFENGNKLMPCELRDEMFGSALRRATGQKFHSLKHTPQSVSH